MSNLITREEILEQARALPPAPRALAQVCELLRDVNSDLREITNLIRLDPALSAEVIRVSNSAAFGAGWEIGSVDEAVARVGFSELLRLVGLATAMSLADEALPAYGIELSALRESLILHALAAEAIAQRVNLEKNTAYAAGLLRWIGAMAMDRAARGVLPPERCYSTERHATYVDWETAEFGMANTDVAMTILYEWRFPAELVGAIGGYHLFPEPGGEDVFSGVLNLAGTIVAQTGRALPGEARMWVLTPAKLEAVNLSETAWREAAGEALALFERQRVALR